MTNKWIVDECPDANGYWTIRVDDGSPNGNTASLPIATVFNLADAESIVGSHNQSRDMNFDGAARELTNEEVECGVTISVT